jgi:hypothetical protein
VGQGWRNGLDFALDLGVGMSQPDVAKESLPACRFLVTAKKFLQVGLYLAKFGQGIRVHRTFANFLFNAFGFNASGPKLPPIVSLWQAGSVALTHRILDCWIGHKHFLDLNEVSRVRPAEMDLQGIIGPLSCLSRNWDFTWNSTRSSSLR